MRITQLSLYHFKNHENATFEFSDKINVFIGLNGCGKTNLLDSLYFLSTTKSYFNHSDQQLIFFDQDECSVSGKVSQHEGEHLVHELLGSFGVNRKKTFKRNGKPYSRLVDHIGFFQTVFITPYDISLVFEGSEERRRFIDFTISQLDKEYLNDLLAYKKTLDQRNAFLKALEGKTADALLLESFDYRLIPLSERIHQKRIKFMSEFQLIFKDIHQYLTDLNNSVGISYESNLNSEDFANTLTKNWVRDIQAQRTTEGVHKDDLTFEIKGLSLKRYGSQGQIKSFVVALKLAQYQYLKIHSGNFPLLLLDDIFEKIDGEKSQRLMQLVCSKEYGQIFISDTHENRVLEHFKNENVHVKLFNL